MVQCGGSPEMAKYVKHTSAVWLQNCRRMALLPLDGAPLLYPSRCHTACRRTHFLQVELAIKIQHMADSENPMHSVKSVSAAGVSGLGGANVNEFLSFPFIPF
ncbi:hypothetical protein CDAR_318921 [Caerostris darwini]|uniref:Uncharacterized protein n=1 Tax=Caerostris darwini TaxID=1538125 RepID=A0AAV4TUE6_9ARAC|nr:hypothetical protein CDAR_318921 [Caerostris darwini]